MSAPCRACRIRGIGLAWVALRPVAQIGTFAALSLAFELLSSSGTSPVFISFKF